MDRIDLSLPNDLHAYVDRRVSSGDYADVGDYVSELIRREQDDHARLLALLDAAAASGECEQTFDEVIDEAIAEARRMCG